MSLRALFSPSDPYARHVLADGTVVEHWFGHAGCDVAVPSSTAPDGFAYYHAVNVRAVASVDHADDIPAARRIGFRTIALVAPGTPSGHWDSATASRARAELQPIAKAAGLPLVVCPAQRSDKAPIDCADCTACQRDGLIVFAAHGAGTKRVVRRLAVVS